MGTVGLRELRQDASGLVRRVEAGEVIDITVAGRLTARMVPAQPRQWLGWAEVADCFDGRPDPQWDRDRDLIDSDLIDSGLSNPWTIQPGAASQ